MSIAPKNRWSLVSALATSDLRFEWVLSTCIIVALTAIIAPLFLLLGLKNGVVENQLNQLIEDPVYRELRPERNEQLSPNWFDGLSARADVAFVVPSVLRGASSVAVKGGKGSDLILDLVPTAANDALLLGNQTTVPEDGQVVLSSTAATRLAADPATPLAIGDGVEVIVSRGGGRPERLMLTVSGILPARADTLARLYVTFDLVEDIETFRSGAPVPARGWSGKNTLPFTSIDYMILFGAEELSRRERTMLRRGTGVSEVQDLAKEEGAALFGAVAAEKSLMIRLVGSGALFQSAQVNVVRNGLRGKNIALLPMIHPLDAKLSLDGAEVKAPLQGMGWSARSAETFGLPKLPWDANLARDVAFDSIAKVLLPESADLPKTGMAELHVTLGAGDIRLPVEIVGTFPGESLIVPPSLAAMLRTGVENKISFDPEIGALSLSKAGYRGFRLYARSIYDVEALEADLLADGIATVTRRDDIERVERLERALTRLFGFVAAIGVIGAGLAMTASLYASVERKHASIGIMRLIGIPRRLITVFPLSQAVIIGTLAGILATVIYFIFAWIVNTNFADDLPFGQNLVVLPAWQIGVAMVMTPLVCAGTAIFAAYQATRIDPADAIRQE